MFGGKKKGYFGSVQWPPLARRLNTHWEMVRKITVLVSKTTPRARFETSFKPWAVLSCPALYNTKTFTMYYIALCVSLHDGRWPLSLFFPSFFLILFKKIKYYYYYVLHLELWKCSSIFSLKSYYTTVSSYRPVSFLHKIFQAVYPSRSTYYFSSGAQLHIGTPLP